MTCRHARHFGSILLLLLAAATAFAGIPVASAQSEGDTKTPIKHLVMLMQENHSFDNYFGTYPGADGFPPKVCIPMDPNDPARGCVRPFHISSSDIEISDPDHSDATSRLQYNGGKMDGFVHALELRNQDGRMAMGFYDDRDLPYYWNLVDRYVLFDRFFSSASGGSLINHLYWVSASPGEEVGKGEPMNNVETIFDRLEERGISWKFYVQNYEPLLTYRTLDQFPGNRASQVIWVPVLNMDRFIDDPKFSSHIVNLDEYYTDLQNGTLPSVAFIAPSGPSEHPPSSLASGQRFSRSLIQALMRSDAWSKSAFIISYDDWGGWYDHVPPPQVDEYGYGFRVPTYLVSPYAKKGHIDSTELDYTSVLKFIEDNWGLEPLTSRDARANNITSAFDFSQPLRPAEYIPWDRQAAEPPSPRRSVIYLVYGGAAALMGLLVLGAVVGDGASRGNGWYTRLRLRRRNGSRK